MKDATEIVYIIDRSASMGGMEDIVKSAFSEFVKEQQSGNDECRLTLIQFNDEYTIEYTSQDINSVIDLDYSVSGMTALRDAIGNGIDALGKRLAALDEDERPERVIFVIQTDGHENSSKEYTRQRISEMIEHQREKYNWQFILMGADFDAESVATDYGFGINNTLNMSKGNYEDAISTTSRKLMNYRHEGTSESLMYSDEEKYNLG